jgi:alpha-L-arabinofuranosidase
MIAGNALPTAVSASSSNPNIGVTAKTDGTVLTLQVVNASGSAQTPTITLIGFTPQSGTMQVTQLAGDRGAENDASHVDAITPKSSSSTYTLSGHTLSYTFAPSSFTIMRLE